MSKLVSFRTEEGTVSALDRIAALEKRDRTYVINEAVEKYIGLWQYHCQLIENGLRQAEEGKVVGHAEVKNFIALKMSKKKRA